MNPLNKSIVALAGIALAGCSTFGGKSAKNQTRYQFLDEMYLTPEYRGGAPSDRFTTVYFARTTVKHLKKQDWWSAQNVRTKQEIEKDANNLANYMTNALNKAAQNYPGKRLTVVPQPGPGTLIIETAITELVPSKAFWNATASAAGFVVPGAGMLSAAGKGVIAIEGRAIDGTNGKVVATFRDRDSDKFAVANVASYTWYHGSQANIDDLAQKTAHVLNAPAGTVVKASAPITLIAF